MLDNSNLAIIKKIVYKYLPSSKYKAFIFGSRVKGDNRKFSDVDLGIIGDGPLEPNKFINMKFDFEDSNLPYFVDVVDFSTVSDRFKHETLKKVIYI